MLWKLEPIFCYHNFHMRPLPLPNQIVVRWLGLMCLLVLAMIALGGITRLTGSGLSITEWQPIMGAIPPLSPDQWASAFAKYQKIPQYHFLNRSMTLEQFKWIFFWEYLHRQMGRSIGLALVLPWAWCGYRGYLSRRLHWRLAIAVLLFGLQGLMGWIMVVSGLTERTSVSHYRLAAHLSLGLCTLSYLLWMIHSELPKQGAKSAPRYFSRSIYTLMALVWIQIVFGAFMAGLKAGLLYSTFPAMNGQWFPSGALALSPVWLNFLENPTAVHFTHRSLGWLILAGSLGMGMALRSQRDQIPQFVYSPLVAAVGITILQFSLGVLTAITHVNFVAAILHQIFGALLHSALFWAALGLAESRPNECKIQIRS